MEKLIITILFIVIGAMAVYIAYTFFIAIQRKNYEKKQKTTVIQIKIPKESEIGPMVAENIYSTLHGIEKKLSVFDKLKGKSVDRISFEIANISGSIRFYAWFPEKFRNLVEGQIYAQYPDIEIEETKDYTNIDPKKEQYCCGVELDLQNPDVYAIKRYPQFEDKTAKVSADPMAAITATLAKFNESDEQAWIQIVIKPLPDKWRVLFTKCLRIVSKGIFENIETFQKAYIRAFITRKRVFKIIFFPLYFYFWFRGLFAKSEIISRSEEDRMDIHKEEIKKSHEKESAMESAIDKVFKLLYETNIRIIYVPNKKNSENTEIKLREIAGSFKQFNIPQSNGFVIKKLTCSKKILEDFKARNLSDSFVLNIEELATIYHIPNLTVKTPNIYWVQSRKLEPPGDLPTSESDKELTIIGKTNFRGVQKEFGIRHIDRRRHVYIIGKTGMGKSTLLENMIYSDIHSGKGVAVIDPHGDLAERVIEFIPSSRTNDTVIIDPSDLDHPVAFNMLENVDPNLNSIVGSGLIGIFKKIYGDSWGPRLEHILRNTILALLEYPDTTMLGITRMLQDEDYRRKIVKKITDPLVKSFWEQEFSKMDTRQRTEAISPILNKVGQFLSIPLIRNIVGQPKSTINLRFMMDKKKIIIVNLSKGKIGEDSSALLGAMIITKFQLDAMSRANIPEKDRTDFYLYVDEFQNFATESFATILSEARKYKLNLTMANQYIAQMPEEVRDAVFGNVGSLLSFQVGFDDAEEISGQFAEEVLPNDIVSLSKYNMYLRLLIDGMPSKTFSAVTLPPPEAQEDRTKIEKIIKTSRERYTRKKEIVEDKIIRWHQARATSVEKKG